MKGRQRLSRRGIPGAAGRAWAASARCPAVSAAPLPRPRAAMLMCCMPGVAFVPALLVCWSSAAFIISYVIAVLAGHVEPFVPYIR